ncbi:MAG TPA: MFS transporter [Thermodesulfovibrionales bacterium]|nr:MFS transporter [Thermodesulfovibrionales bacterium]
MPFDFALRNLALSHDGRLLFSTRSFRLFAYGFLSVVLMIYLAKIGLNETQIGLLFTLALVGDTVISFWITTTADRRGRRRMLIVGALLMVFAGGLFATTDNFALLLIAATIGVISPSGYEVGPFLPIELAALSHIVPDERRTRVFAWYNLAGSFATALGALFGGVTAQALQGFGMTPTGSYRVIVVAYATVGLMLGYLFMRLSDAVEVPHYSDPSISSPKLGRLLGLDKSRVVVLKLSALFSLDAFAGGFVLQSIVAYWFHVRFNVQPAALGAIFFGANILAGLSALSASWVASRIGLIRTMVFTHIPSNILLILVPLMPNLFLAITVLLLRFSISQMDVPTRQSYTMAIMGPDERSAAAGLTGIARTTGASLSPVFSGPLLASPALLNMPFFLSGGLKIIYDLLLYRSFRNLKPPEEKGTSVPQSS